MQSTPKRKMTTPGLGETGKRDKVTIREEDAAPESRQNISCPDPISPLVPDALWHADVCHGPAMKIASRGRPSSAPRLARGKLDASKAPLDSQSAYVLSLIDGSTPIEGIADITGIPVDRLTQIIERLERLGFVAGH